MDTPSHTLSELFKQLGLPHEHHQIEEFIKAHSLENTACLCHAEFWSTAQSSFLNEARDADSDWCVLVDELAVRLTQG